jgi:alanyl-tRNA synthetase
MRTDELREKYLVFFESKGCVRRPSDVLVPPNDPTVLFTPAGMNQFKDHFLGRCKLDFTRATTCQKCLRTGDIDNVGRTAYHHTFFEMLGNFSFGDYFKRDAIHWAWEFLTHRKWLHLPADKLSVTVYLDDDEAANVWLDEIGLPSDRVQRMGEDENFWPANAPSQGPDGVCGPCSEIYYQAPFGQVEIWNLVFTQFNRVGSPPDNLRPLPSKNIDTGMGLERTAAALQGVETNFHIDILRPLVETAGDVCGVRYDADDENGRRLRRIADHVRAATFAIHENVYPGNKKQGYIIRRLLRRAVLDGHHLGVREPFLHKLVAKVAELMRDPYPELGQTVPGVANTIKNEEASFLGTLDAGLSRIERIFAEMKSQHRGIVSAADAADMFQTHGFPPELFETLAAERNLTFDWKGFQKEMERHGIDSGGGGKKGDVFAHDPLEGLKKAMHGNRFLGYDALEVSDAKVIGIIANDQLCDRIDEVDHEHPIVVVLDKTPFYGEMGGQVGDRGEIVSPRFHFEVIDTQTKSGFTLHHGHLREGQIELGATATARVDMQRRQGISRAHTATHLLHHALQKVLGPHAKQQGSKVDDDWLRFDFPNPSPVSEDELVRIENEVNDRILAGEPVGHVEMPLAEARTTGATMLFGEKYCDVVRVVSVGEFSKELCGGTHLTNSSLVGIFKIVGEESVAAGTRRITALTGRGAMESIRKVQSVVRQAAGLLKIPPEELPERVEALAKEMRQLRKQAAAGPKGGLSVDQMIATAAEVAGVKVVITEVPGGPNELRQMIDQLRRKASPVAVLLANRQEEEKKVTLIAGLSRDLVERGLDAVKWVKVASAVVEGGGGGRPDMAQAGGKLPEQLPAAFEVARKEIERLLKGG